MRAEGKIKETVSFTITTQRIKYLGINLPEEAKDQHYDCCCLVAQSCPTLCNPMDCSPPGSSLLGILQQESWTGWPFLLPGNLPDPGIKLAPPVSPALAGRFFTTEPPGKHYLVLNQVTTSNRLSHFQPNSLCVCTLQITYPDNYPQGNSQCNYYSSDNISSADHLS